MALTRTALCQFEAFAAVAELRSFAAAADRLGLTASAISQLVAELESTLGFRVFDRTTRRVNLSSAGRDFLTSVESVLRHAQMAETVANDVRQRATGVVRVGAPLVLASTALPQAIKDYALLRPKVVVRLHDVAVDMLVDSVAHGDVDLAVGPDRVTGSSVASAPAFDSPWVLWCAPSHALARKRSIRWDELRDVALVAAGRDHERSVARMLAHAPADARITPVQVVDNVSTAMGLAAHGLAVTLAPAYVDVLARHFGLVQRRIVEPEAIRQVCIYQPMARAISPAAQGFSEFLLPWLGRWSKTIHKRKSSGSP